MNAVLAMTAKTHVAVDSAMHGGWDPEDDDRGAVSVELLGLMLLFASVAAALLKGGIGGTIATAVADAIKAIIGDLPAVLP